MLLFAWATGFLQDMALFWRIWAAVTVVTCIVLAVFVGLATLQFDRIHSGLVGERLIVLADRTAAPFKAAARIGLPLATVRNAAALLERARQTDELIKTVHVFEASGRIVHSTAISPPSEISPAAAAARREAAGAPWHLQNQEGFLGGIDIPGRGDKTAGGILVFYPREVNATQVRAIAAELGLAAILILLGAGLLGGLLVRLGLGRQIRAFQEIDDAVAAFERDAWRRAAAASPDWPSHNGRELQDLLDTAEAKYRAAGHAIAASRQPPQ